MYFVDFFWLLTDNLIIFIPSNKQDIIVAMIALLK